MKLTILGSGTSILTKKRSGPAYLLEIKNKKLLFDCGSSAFRSLVQANIDWSNIDYFFITHSHSDHLADLVPILQGIFVKMQFVSKEKRKKPNWLFGPPGFRKAYNQLTKIMFPEIKYFPIPIRIRELSNSSIRLNGFKIKTRLVTHVDEFFKSIAYRIEAEDKIFAYSGDTGICPGIKAILKNADLSLVEACQLVGHDEFNNHLSPRKAGELAQKVGVKELILTHLYDIDSPQKVLASCKKEFKGRVILAKDFLKIKL